MRHHMLFLLAVCLCQPAFAQINSSNSGKQPKLPSWQTYEFMRYGGVGATLYTGTVNYSVPVYTYTDRDFEIPITLEYATNGLRVNHKSGDLSYEGAMDFKDGASEKREYTWDANGNMTSDMNKRIFSITYNELDLPRTVYFNDGHATEYVYAADGRKLSSRYLLSGVGFITPRGGSDDGSAGGLRGGIFPDDPPPGPVVNDGPVVLTSRDYVGDHVYVNGSLERVVNPYGYWADTCYFYHVRDYQGNVRAVVDGSGVLREVNGYYPYGGLQGGGAAGVQPMKYGSKELDREGGLDLYDSLARWYDPFRCQPTTQDPLAEKCYNLSPYLWCAGNPIANTDPSGRMVRGKTSQDANTLLEDLKCVVDESDKLKAFVNNLSVNEETNTFNSIPIDMFNKFIKGMTEDENALAALIYKTINSPMVHYISYYHNILDNPYDVALVKNAFSKSDGQAEVISNALRDMTYIPGIVLEELGGLTLLHNEQTYSFVSVSQVNRCVLSCHEVFGHGRANEFEDLRSEIKQHAPTVQLNNLIFRLNGIMDYDYGVYHGPKSFVEDYYALPTILLRDL